MANYRSDKDNFVLIYEFPDIDHVTATNLDREYWYIRCDVYEWIKENIEVDGWEYDYDGIYFYDETDVMAFKLRWL